ncbi:UNVERIFIED_CONTAM: hypothetical protein Sradi_4636100 [Sesamum radiatum]|uniref:Uncharacterized protein n=1 Tax=Sesamum radiatum TaxID=300843 RepID=A0AAW2NDI0_SESRA
MKTGTSLHAKRKRVIVELVKGKEIATRLQTLLRIPGQDHGSSSVSPGDLAFQILRSFNKTLSVLSSSCAATSPRIAAVDCGGSACSGESKQKPGVKSRRGCYKRRSDYFFSYIGAKTTPSYFFLPKFFSKSSING